MTAVDRAGLRAGDLQTTVHRLEGVTAHLSRLVDRAPPGPWVDLGRQLLGQVRSALRCVGAPIRFFFVAGDWTDLRGQVTSVAGDLQLAALPSGPYWKGRAADAYRQVIPPHAAAALRLGTVADRTQTALTWSAAAGCAFYVGLLAVVVQFAIAFEGVIAAVGTVALSWVGIQLAIAQMSLGVAEVGVLTALLVAALTTQGIQLNNLLSEAADQSAFPGGHWPPAATDRYRDATVADGDADWSVVGIR